MRTLKNNWLRAGLGLLTAMLVLGAFFIVKAKQRNVEPIEVKTAVKKSAQSTHWYPVDSSDPLNPKVLGSPIAAPPVSAASGCAQTNPSSMPLCAIQLEVPEENYEFTEATDLDALPSGITTTGLTARSPNQP